VASVVVVGGLVAALTASSWGRRGSSSSQLQLNPGTAWFVDIASGTVSLLDGATAYRVSEQPVANPGDNIEVFQSGTQSDSGAYVVNHTTGTVTAIDGATLVPGRPVPFSPPKDSDLAVASNSHATWVISHNATLAQQIIPTSLAGLGPAQAFSSEGGTPVETPDGTLWTAGTGSYIYSYAAGVARTRIHPPLGLYRLVEADDRPVTADTTTGKALVLDPDSGQVRSSVPFNPPGSDPIVSGSGAAPYLISVDTLHAELQVTDLKSRHSTGTVIIGNPNSGYGPPVINGNLVFVPNLVQGAVVVVEIEHDQLSVIGQIGVQDHQFHLLVANGSTWFDDPHDGVAGVISADLTAWIVPKTGGIGQGDQIGHLGPIGLAEGTSINARSPQHQSGGLVTARPTHPDGSTSSSSGRGTSTSGSQSTGSHSTGPTSPGTPVPDFDWTPTNPQVRQPVTFIDATSGPHHVYQWTFSGATPAQSTAPSPTVTWDQPSTYNVVLVITEAGQSYAVQHLVTITNQTTATTTTTITPHHRATTTTSTSTTSTSTSTSTTTTTVPLKCPGGQVDVGAFSPTQVYSETVSVPNGCHHADFLAQGGWGGGAGSAPTNATGGQSEEISVTGYPVKPNSTLKLVAGRAGAQGTPTAGAGTLYDPGGAGGAPGGGDGGCGTNDGDGGGGGGGYSSVQTANGADILIAAGGGGANGDGNNGGGGAFGSGLPQDATQSSGGAGQGSGVAAGQQGASHQGGYGGPGNTATVCDNADNSNPASLEGGGGGGGGVFGGGGGALLLPGSGASIGSGGAGSGLAPAGGSVRLTGEDVSQGFVRVTWIQ
jgi:hypothetical protein